LQDLVVRKITHVLNLQEPTANDDGATVFAKKDTFSTKKIIDHLMRHLEMPSSNGDKELNREQQSTGGDGEVLGLYADEGGSQTHLLEEESAVPITVAASALLGQQKKKVAAAVSRLPNALASLLIRSPPSVAVAAARASAGTAGASKSSSGILLTLFELGVNTLARKLFYAGQVYLICNCLSCVGDGMSQSVSQFFYFDTYFFKLKLK
jgi:hypothetical protein